MAFSLRPPPFDTNAYEAGARASAAAPALMRPLQLPPFPLAPRRFSNGATAVAATQQRPRAKSSSERGRAFRARQRQREAEMTRYVDDLREQVLALERSRMLKLEASVRAPHTPGGSLQCKIWEFFTLFRDGLAGDITHTTREVHSPLRADIAHDVARKEHYIRQAFDPDARVGDLTGVNAAIDQWRRYTVFHDRFRLDLSHIEVMGASENLTFHLHVKLTVLVSRKTFQNVFPFAMYDEALVQKFIHREVQYDCVVWFRFTEDGRISFYSVDVNFIDGLRRAGGTLEEVAKMLQHAMITPSCTFRDDALHPAIRHHPAVTSRTHIDGHRATQSLHTHA